MKKIQNTEDLRSTLLESIQSVRTGELGAASAQAIARLSGQVLQSARLDLDVAKHNKKLINGKVSTPLGKQKAVRTIEAK